MAHQSNLKIDLKKMKFSLRKTVLSHGWVNLPPYKYDYANNTLHRTEVINGNLTELLISQKENFIKEYKILATNRHLKVIGIFTRLCKRDKKNSYLKHIPRLWKLIEYNLNFYSLSELNKWINEFFPKKFRIRPKL